MILTKSYLFLYLDVSDFAIDIFWRFVFRTQCYACLLCKMWEKSDGVAAEIILTKNYLYIYLDVSDFAMAAIHTSPKAAELEIDHLVDVYDDIVQRWQLKDVMILGDYNAGCSYVTRSEWLKIRLATDKRFYWLFSDLMDTTVAKSDCPYDR